MDNIFNESYETYIHSLISQVNLILICYNIGMRQIDHHHNHQRTQLCYIT